MEADGVGHMTRQSDAYYERLERLSETSVESITPNSLFFFYNEKKRYKYIAFN